MFWKLAWSGRLLGALVLIGVTGCGRRTMMTDEMIGDGMERPDQIVVTWFKDASARHAFETDPEFEKVAEIRDRSVKLVTVTGRSVFGDGPS